MEVNAIFLEVKTLEGHVGNGLNDRAAPSSSRLVRTPAHLVTFRSELSKSVAGRGSN